MATLELTPEERNHLEEVVQVELTRRGWQLAFEPRFFATRHGFYDRVEARLRERWEGNRQPFTDESIRKAMFYEYCALMHTAFQRNGTHLQTIAFNEAYHYAWPYIIRKCADSALAQSVLMQALTTAWQKIAQCKSPGAFLAWFAKIAINHLNAEFRKLEQVANELSDVDLQIAPDPDDDRPALEILLDHFSLQPNEIESLLRELSYPSLLQKLHRCLNNVLQEFILMASFRLEMQVSEIARLLMIKATAVANHKFQALYKIRTSCPYVVDELRGLLS